MTVAEVIAEVRPLVGDNVSPYRFEDPRMLLWANMGEEQICNTRPDALVTDVGERTERTRLTATTDAFVVGEPFRAALVDYICARCQMQDSEQAGDRQKMQDHLQLFGAEV